MVCHSDDGTEAVNVIDTERVKICLCPKLLEAVEVFCKALVIARNVTKILGPALDKGQRN